MLNEKRFRYCIEMLTSRIMAMESVHRFNESQLEDHNLSHEDRRCRLRLIHSADQRLTDLKRELVDLQSCAINAGPPG